MTRRRDLPPRRQPEPTADLIGRVLSLAGLGEQVYRLDIFRRWAEAVGPKIAQRTSPQSFSRGTLVVRAASSTWQNELMFLRGAIIAKLNGLLGAPRVKELRVISGHLPQHRAPDPRAAAAPRPEDLAAATACARAIGDPEVRAAFVQLMARTLVPQAAAAATPRPNRG